MKRLPFLSSLAATASVAAIATVVACGGISDPTRSSGERVATVSGALTGMTVPANTRVALVWKVGPAGGLAVGSDVAVVNGKFTMDLPTPPNGYFLPAESDYDDLSGSDRVSPAEEPPPPDGSGGDPAPDHGGSTSSSSGGQSFELPSQLTPRDTVSGGINQPLSIAVAGFVVYVDTNGNGQLDITGNQGTTTDDVIGGNKELLLAYLRDGGSLDYEKLRDRSGILPKAGYNLAWEEGRWLPLDVVELKLTNRTRLPGAVCSGTDAHYDNDDRPVLVPPSSSSGGTNGYPDPNDPNLTCAPDGRSWSYSFSGECEDPEPTPPPPEGLCSPHSYGAAGSPPCPGGGYGDALTPDQPVPDGWPCPVNDQDGGPAPDIDGGAAPDAGQ